LKKEFDYVICTGPSHFGALLLYEPDDFVARFDFHGDFIAERSDLVVGENYASYMNTVKRDIKPKRIFNYGWGGLNSIEKAYAMDLCGELGFVGDNNHLQANHFDIDVDCFRNDLKMSKYHHCGNLLPKQVETMISEVKPKKIGVWEYRPFFDRGNGVKFLETLIQSL
ncbi:MAG: hypothetical protein KKH40_01545, partial [Nanoarchaeota archaeon]|nr:hypothetical protein [Nanoarchaeota archaeon]